MGSRPKLAVFWSASCGGCEIALTNLHEKLLDVLGHFDFVFCPCLLDTKRSDVEAMPDGSLALTLFNGAIRTEENEEMAHLLRRKSQLLVACGACAATGGIPALANLRPGRGQWKTMYCEGPSLDNPARTIPQEKTSVPEGCLTLPRYYDEVQSLDQVVEVDYTIPGCPPEATQLGNVLGAFIRGETLPPRGSVLGAGTASVCSECERKRKEKTISRFHRTWEFIPDPETCLLDQGIVCMGVATRSGCGAPCPRANAPCIGCYGPPDDVYDQGAKMISTLGSVLDIGPLRILPGEDAINARVDESLAGIPDPAGVACKFTSSRKSPGKHRRQRKGS